MKNIELRLISELMKNSRRSDRDLAKALGVSQPTVSRTIKKLEKEGYVERYTVLPNFGKLGFKILAFTFVKVGKTITPEEREKARGLAREILKKGPFEIVMGERGMGMGCDGIFMSYHESYSDYTKLVDWFRQFKFLEVGEIRSFIVNLEDEIRYHPLDFSTLANHLATKKEEKE